MEPIHYILIALGACSAFWIIVILLTRHFKKEKTIRNGGIVETKNNRFTLDQNITTTEGDVNISYNKADKFIQMGTSCVIGKKDGIKAGKYTILSTDDSIDTFNIRIGTYVKAYKHGTDIVVADGDIITPVSCSIILR